MVPRVSLVPGQSKTLLVHLEKAKTRRCRKSLATKQLVADPRRSEQRGKSACPSVFFSMRTTFESYISPREILYSSTVSVWSNRILTREYLCRILKWTYDAETDEYYLSLFTPEQPDLNWENPEVRAAVHDVMHFWLERGACGYRMDVINLISKDQRFPDAEPTLGPDLKYHPGSKYYINGPRMHEYLQEIKHKVLQKHGAITVGEMPGVSDIDEVMRTVRSKNGELNMIFIFDVVDLDNEPGQGRMTLREWSVKDLARVISKWQRAMLEHDGWNSVFIENHDNPRSVSRYCDDGDAYREYGAKLLALMQTTLSGTLFVYQGEELGMKNVWLISELP